MPKKMILHIGLPKTGTTSIQASLGAARDMLAQKGIAYVSREEFGKFRFPDMKAKFDEVADKLRLCEQDTILISNESLTWQGRYETVAQAFCRSMADYDINVIAYATDHVRLAERGYRQNAVYNNGMVDPPKRYVEKRIAQRAFDYHALRTGWLENSNVRSFRVIDYDTCGDSVTSFGLVMSLDLPKTERHNTSLGSAACEVALGLKKAGMGKAGRLKSLAKLANDLKPLPNRPFIDDDLAERIRSHPNTTSIETEDVLVA